MNPATQAQLAEEDPPGAVVLVLIGHGVHVEDAAAPTADEYVPKPQAVFHGPPPCTGHGNMRWVGRAGRAWL